MAGADPREGMGLAEGRYRLVTLLGRGGMGEVWKGRDERLRRDVAVKLIRDPGSGQLAGRFRDEARAASKVRHPHLVRLYDFGEDSEFGPWMITELLPGKTLGDRFLDEGRLAEREVRERLAPQLLEALQALHDGGIVHRDVKPGNVLITARGGFALGDFGLALFEGKEIRTRSGLFVGTPGYAAPEQVTGAGVGPASDTYAAALILFEALTGRLPFAATTPAGLLHERVSADLRPEALRLFGLDPAWAEILAPSLEREVGARSGRPDQLLERIRGGGGKGPRRRAEASEPRDRAGGTPTAERATAGRGGGQIMETVEAGEEGRIRPPARAAARSVRILGGVIGLAFLLALALRFLGGDGTDPSGLSNARSDSPWLEGIASRTPLHDPAHLDAFVDWLERSSARGGKAEARKRARVAEILTRRGGVGAPAWAMLMATRPGESPDRAMKLLVRAMGSCFRGAAPSGKPLDDGAVARVWPIADRLRPFLEKILNRPGDGGPSEATLEESLDELLDATRFMPWAKVGAALRVETLMRRIWRHVWARRWGEDLPDPLRQHRWDDGDLPSFTEAYRRFGDQRARIVQARSDRRMALLTRDGKVLRRIDDTQLGAYRQAVVSWWTMYERLLDGPAGRTAGRLRLHLLVLCEVATVWRRSHLREDPRALRASAPFMTARLVALAQRTIHDMLRLRGVVPLDGETTPERRDLDLLDGLREYGELLWLVDRPRFARRWAAMEECLDAMPGRGFLDVGRIVPLELLGQPERAIALARRIQRDERPHVGSPAASGEDFHVRIRIQDRLLGSLLRPSAIRRAPDATAELVRWGEGWLGGIGAVALRPEDVGIIDRIRDELRRGRSALAATGDAPSGTRGEN